MKNRLLTDFQQNKKASENAFCFFMYFLSFAEFLFDDRLVF